MLTLKMDKNKHFFYFLYMDVFLAFLLPWVGQVIDFAKVICLFTLFFFAVGFFVFIFFWPCYVTYVWDFYFTRYWTQALGSENMES